MAKALTKSEIVASIVKTTGLTRKQVGSVCEAMSGLMKSAVCKKGPGLFVMPGLMKVTVVQKPAVPAHKGINPFTVGAEGVLPPGRRHRTNLMFHPAIARS